MKRWSLRNLMASSSAHLILLLGALVSLGPLLWVFKTSITPLADIFQYPPELLPSHPTFENFPRLLEAAPFLRNMLNSLVVASAYTILTMVLSTLVGYGFAKFHQAPGASMLFFIVLGSIMVPFHTTALSLFLNVARLGWTNTFAGLVIPLVANGFGAFMMTQFIRNFPDELLEAARIDGCGELQMLFKIVIPVMRPALGALAVLQFVHSWNDFFWPLLVLSKPDLYTYPLVLGSFVVQQAVVPYDLIAAGITVTTIPMIIAFILAQRQFIAGLTMGAFK